MLDHLHAETDPPLALGLVHRRKVPQRCLLLGANTPELARTANLIKPPERVSLPALELVNPCCIRLFGNGEGGIRTHGGLRLAGFQDRKQTAVRQ